MSDSQVYEEVTVSSEGVTVVKRFEEDEFPVPAIAFEFTSDREEDATVVLRDDVPETVAVEDLGFHPEYGSEFWTIEDEEITFEKEVEAGGEYTTVYGIRATGTEDIERFLTEPTLVDVDPSLSGTDSGSDIDDVVSGGDDAVKDAISGDGEVPGLEEEDQDEETGVDDEDIETLDLNDPTAEQREARAAAQEETTESSEVETEPDDTSEEETETTESDAGDGHGDESDLSVDGSLVGALAEELRENEVSAEDVKLLRRALELAGKEGGSVDARLQRLQGDVADLRAYTDALEEFLDENGTGTQVVEEAREQIDEFETQLEEFEDTADEMESQLETTTTTVESVESEVADLEAELDEVRDRMAGEDVAERLDDLEEEVRELREWQDQIQETFGG